MTLRHKIKNGKLEVRKWLIIPTVNLSVITNSYSVHKGLWVIKAPYWIQVESGGFIRNCEKMPKLKSSGSVRPKPIPSNCKYKYCDFMEPVYETQRVSKKEVETLCCQVMHCIRLKHMEHKENDNLYNIFSLHAGQDCNFIR